MVVVSMVNGLTADYQVVEDGTTIITVKSDHEILHGTLQAGLGVLSFVNMKHQPDLSYSFSQTFQAGFEETAAPDGTYTITIRLGTSSPATGLMRKGGVGEIGGSSGIYGEFYAPGVRIPARLGEVWVALLRSPGHPVRLEIGKTQLSLSNGDGQASATLNASEDAGFSGELSVSGSAYKKASLTLRRTLGDVTFEEVLGETDGRGGLLGFEWKPVTRNFDLLLVGGGAGAFNWNAEKMAKTVARAIGSDWLPQADFVLCESPMIKYKVTLKGERGMLKQHDEDSSDLSLELSSQ